IFDEFMDTNNLYSVALGDLGDDEVLQYFLHASLPTHLIDDLMAFFEVIKRPVAVRSSSLLEDAHYQPFAGVYSTYMIPNMSDKYEMLKSVGDAIKGVYASVFYKDSKAYMTATSNLIESEKMAIVLQEVIGRQYGNHLYPTISGVAKSLNFYPIGNETAEDGIANIALGLGKYVVDGGVTLRFSPRHPHNILQMSTMDFTLRETQTHFLALDMKDAPLHLSANDAFNLVKLSVKDADRDGILKYIVSTFDPQDQIIRDGYYPGGRKILSFANILQYDMLPLSETLNELLEIGQKEMGRPVEIEFAVDIKPDCRDKGSFYMLQIRPIVDQKELVEENLELIDKKNTILYSKSVLGHGIVNNVYHVLYVKTDAFNSSNNQLIAYDIERINRQFTGKDEGYVLAGPGRWGSSDLWLGIPVKWPYISNARVIAEYSLANYHTDPSQGTHFFQNLTSCGTGYFTINPNNGDLFDEDYLNTQPAAEETKYLRLVRFETPILIKMDGKKSIGVVMKPNDKSNP
ncbi:MAG TPA: phosphoenolpyruvate synthase, partial [Porphyromonadaceae bacterium]|nr:phosphoenolpyruvate synthase [Porphyromonadaceae bacterium]